MKIVIDANVYASSLIKPDGIPGKILIFILNSKQYKIVTSPSIFNELERILWYQKVRSRIMFSDKELKAWLFSMRLLTEEVVDSNYISSKIIVEKDPDDDKYILAAMATKARIIITGDKHLLDLNPYHKIEIIKPSEFFAIYYS
jgi:uncharacterized protein